MTKAYECDRCGELFGEPPAMRVASSSVDVGGDAYAVERKRNRVGGLQLSADETLSSSRKAKITHGDLCEECAEAFREYWEAGGE